MSDDQSIEAVAEHILSAISEARLPAAHLTTSPESHDAYFSVIASRSGKTLNVHTCIGPSAFTAMRHAKPKSRVALGSLDKGREVEALRAAAARLSLPSGSRAIPFVLLTSTTASDTRICGVAFDAPLHATAVLRGHDRRAELQAIVIGAHELAVVGIDGYSDRFGRVVLRQPISSIERVDLDEGAFGFKLASSEAWWRLQNVDPAEGARARALFKSLGTPIRMLVATDPNTREWRPDER